jgi:hypothetical protein
MAVRISTGLRNFILDSGFKTAFDSDGRIDIYTGSQPANADADVSGTLLGTLSLAATGFGAASSGTETAASITSDTNADASGTAGWFRLYKAADGVGGSSATKRRLDGNITATGGGGDMTLDVIAITAGGTIAVSSFTVTMPAS